MRAAELKYINTPRSEIGEHEANAIARLIETTGALDEVVICTSSNVVIKTGGRLMSWVLTESEIRIIQSDPTLMRAPQRLLEVLSRAAATSSTDETRDDLPWPLPPQQELLPQQELPAIGSQLGMTCPTCGHRPVEAHDRWRQRRDLTIVWLAADLDDPEKVIERRHCQHCLPPGPNRVIACELCGDGPMLSGTLAGQTTNGTPPTIILAWLRAQGWRHTPGRGLTCAGHPST